MKQMKINLLMKKEEIDHKKIDHTTIAVVIDILMATTTITAALSEGADSVVPVLNESEARKEKQKYGDEEVCLAGEDGGVVIDGFLNPVPSLLCKHVAGKKVVLSTTNGTIAIRSAAHAQVTYASSLLNSGAVAQDIVRNYNGETILIICSGSSNQFCLEDFYGAGHLINELMKITDNKQLALSDSAEGAALFYNAFSNQPESILNKSSVGQMLKKAGLEQDIKYTCQKNTVNLIPKLKEQQMMI